MIKITVAYAAPERQIEIRLEVESNCSVAMAIKKSGLLQQFPEIPFPQINVGIYGRRVLLDHNLSEGDRVEIYRPLKIDPKQARRSRANLD